MTRPLFILSMPRAGSTLLQRLLLASGQCASLGEPTLLLRFLEGGEAIQRRATYGEWLVATAMSDMRREWGDFDDAYRKGVRDLMISIYEGLSDGKPWFIDKTPRYTLIAEEIKRVFPDAAFVVLWRHPLAVAVSLCETFCGGRWWMDDFSLDLIGGMESLRAFAANHAEDIFQLRYEDLVTRPHEEMARLGEFLGIEGLNRVIEDGPASTAGGSLGDPTGVNRYGGVSGQSRDAWKEELDNWLRRGWAKNYFESGSRSEWLAELGYTLPEVVGYSPWWKGDVWGGIRDWGSAGWRRERRIRRPKWQWKAVKDFRKKHGYEIGFH